jgi:hypothetical protein
MSRFWFVPEDMSFKRSDDMLLFDKGRMCVKTEYVFNNVSGEADPANEEFAKFFTDHYQEIAQRYPVYEELFEYAKMVSLAKYLKESGIPLFWFLMANKDLVITEDSPGTVDALAKGSDYFKNIYIEGGVNLATQGNYVYDTQAVKAITDALAKLPRTAHSQTSFGSTDLAKSISESFSFDLQGQSYSVLPQHSLTSGKDRRGIRYQTDVAFRDADFYLTEQSLDELAYDITRMLTAKLASEDKQPSEQAPKDELLKWYERIYEQASNKTKKLQAKLKQLKNQRFQTEHEFVQAVEKAIDDEAVADWVKVLAIKHGYYNTILELVRYYNPRQRDCGEFGEGWHLMVPYRITPAGPAKREFANILVPEQMVVQNLVTGEREALTFSTDRYSIAGYVPEKLGSSQVIGLFIMSDASYRLVDKLGNGFWFDQAGYLTDMSFSESHHIHVEYLHMFTDAFERPPYRIEPADKECVEFANVTLPKAMVVKDLINDSNETLTFSDKGPIAGYVPQNEEKSRFKILAIMSNASFRLLGKRGNEIAFSSDGKFECFAVSSDCPMVKSISAGPYKVNFNYTIDPSGGVLIASARLFEEGKTKPVYAVRYEYDNEGRLCNARGSENQVAELNRPTETMLVAANTKKVN